jgi:hypothetical protein
VEHRRGQAPLTLLTSLPHPFGGIHFESLSVGGSPATGIVRAKEATFLIRHRSGRVTGGPAEKGNVEPREKLGRDQAEKSPGGPCDALFFSHAEDLEGKAYCRS